MVSPLHLGLRCRILSIAAPPSLLAVAVLLSVPAAAQSSAGFGESETRRAEETPSEQFRQPGTAPKQRSPRAAPQGAHPQEGARPQPHSQGTPSNAATARTPRPRAQQGAAPASASRDAGAPGTATPRGEMPRNQARPRRGRRPYPLFRPVALPAYGKYPPPPGYVQRSRGNTGFLVVGTATLVVTYAASIIYGAANDFENQGGFTALPVAGPFVAAGNRDFSCPPLTGTLDPVVLEENARACQEKTVSEATAVAVLAGLGLGQLFGATLTTAGLLDRTKVWVRTDLVGSDVSSRGRWEPQGGVLRLGGRF